MNNLSGFQSRTITGNKLSCGNNMNIEEFLKELKDACAIEDNAFIQKYGSLVSTDKEKDSDMAVRQIIGKIKKALGIQEDRNLFDIRK